MTSNTQHRMPSTADMDTGNMSLCRYCNRHFNAERLAKHEKICEKMAHTKRKIFDAARHRLRGTDAEKYVKKAQTRSSGKSGYSSAAAASGMSAGLKKNNWRKKHEEFIQAIRAAKQVQAHLARGGKLSDLPPPPPSENPDYIQCPHCSRRFNESAAERHIPRCATMLHNKPKPAQGTQRRR
uniref:Zinc finger C2HC domain-containing protein 1C n=3 Tax=Ceratitis capitata TaxID=7213 RepID=W8BE77_CERCA